jgi:hypothetical protein
MTAHCCGYPVRFPATARPPADRIELRSVQVTEVSPVESHPQSDIWEHMPPAKQAELRAEDSDAWKHVVGVLLLIISIGLVLAIGTALLSGVLG